MVVRALYGLIRKYKPFIIFLFETKIRDHRIDGVRRCMRVLGGFNVAPIRKPGGLSLWWDDSLEVDVIYSLKNIIDAQVREVGEQKWGP